MGLSDDDMNTSSEGGTGEYGGSDGGNSSEGNDTTAGGVVDRYPMVNQHWTGNNIGDWYVGGKLNLMSEGDNKPAAFALKVMAKIPTGKKDVGVSTGKLDTSFDAILSKEVNQVIELSGFAGYEFRGKPEGFETPNGANRYAILVRIQTATKAETRARRIEQFIGMLERHEKIHP